MRDQLILNLARTDVQDYFIALIDNLLKNHNITFIKWDMNRNVCEPGGWKVSRIEPLGALCRGCLSRLGNIAGATSECDLAKLFGGGGRADLGILRFADQIWVSDNTMPRSVCEFRKVSRNVPGEHDGGLGHGFGAEYLPLEFAFTSRWRAPRASARNYCTGTRQTAKAKRLIERYKDIRQIVQFGHQYRLRSAFTGHSRA